jgi:hypothetical protein
MVSRLDKLLIILSIFSWVPKWHGTCLKLGKPIQHRRRGMGITRGLSMATRPDDPAALPRSPAIQQPLRRMESMQ